MTIDGISALTQTGGSETLEFKATRPKPRREETEREVSNCGCPMRI